MSLLLVIFPLFGLITTKTICPNGYLGNDCSVHNDECVSLPCLNGGTCISNKTNGYKCICSEGNEGINCEKVVLECSKNPCRQECSNKDTCLLKYPSNPWINCPNSNFCWSAFANGVCEQACNTKNCLLDGNDCKRRWNYTNIRNSKSAIVKCNELLNNFCLSNYGNGYCDKRCDVEECGWDDLDCENKVESKNFHAKGVIFITINLPLAILLNNSQILLNSIVRELSTIVGALFRVKLDEFGKKQIEEVKKDNNTNWSKVALIVDNRKCVKDCFNDTNEIASFLSVFDSRTKSLTRPRLPSGWSIKAIESEHLIPQGNASDVFLSSWIYYAFAIGVVASMGVLVIGSSKRKVISSFIWFPDECSTTGHRVQSRNVSTYSAASGNYLRGPKSLKTFRNQRIEYVNQEMKTIDKSSSLLFPPNEEKSDAIYKESADPRSWSAQHYEAYGETSDRINDLISQTLKNVETYDKERINEKIDVVGPGGLTPLMIAASLRGDVPYCGITNDADNLDNDADINTVSTLISDLLFQGANIDRTTEKTGETSLHLAARYARADAAKRLLDAGADCNAMDSTGRTPLHTAIAADARGVFDLLLRNRATNLNARTLDGTTPLILASRLACESMLKQLLAAEADVNACDESGKTALHWAAAVNNVDAIRLLLNNGANKDVQDHKDETPLFLAAREGAPQACRILLENYANRDITDHMDRLPRDVAAERAHSDIVKLLEEFKAPLTPKPNVHLSMQHSILDITPMKKPHGNFKSLRSRKVPKLISSPQRKNSPLQKTFLSDQQVNDQVSFYPSNCTQNIANVSKDVMYLSTQANCPNLVNTMCIKTERSKACNKSFITQTQATETNSVSLLSRMNTSCSEEHPSLNSYECNISNQKHGLILSPAHSCTTNQSPYNLSNTPTLSSPSMINSSNNPLSTNEESVVNKLTHTSANSYSYVHTGFCSISASTSPYSSATETCYLTPSPDSPSTWSTTCSSPPVADWSQQENYGHVNSGKEKTHSQGTSSTHQLVYI